MKNRYRNLVKLFALVLAIAITIDVSAQIMSGSIAPLKNQNEVNVMIDFSETLFRYPGIPVTRPGVTEEWYISYMTEGEDEEKIAELLSKWKDFQAYAHKELVDGLNNAMNNRVFLVGDYPDAEYTILVKVSEIATGYNIDDPFKKSTKFIENLVSLHIAQSGGEQAGFDSKVIARLSFVRTGETTPFATVRYKYEPSNKSSNREPDFVQRIAMSFNTLGDAMGKHILNKIR